MKDIGVDAVIDRIRLSEQVSDPSTPATGYGYLYIKSGGIYFMGDDGLVIGPLSPSTGGGTDVLGVQIFS